MGWRRSLLDTKLTCRKFAGVVSDEEIRLVLEFIKSTWPERERSYQSERSIMQGMKAGDMDVAFVCAMIPHHQGAIDMAKAELAHGDDEWAKEMAQKASTPRRRKSRR
jgi:hypothetical protein